MQGLRENLNKRVAPPSPKKRSNSNSRKALLEALAAQERLAKAGESSFRATNVLGLHFDARASKRGENNYDNAAASRAGVSVHDPEGCFHILSCTPFTQRGICFPTVHHFVMAERFKGSPLEAELPAAASLWEIDRLCEVGEQNGWERGDWSQVRLNALIIGTYLKFRQNPDALKVLIRTKQRTIVQENLPLHYQKWIAHEKVEKKKADEDEQKDDYYTSSRSARARSKSASEIVNEKIQKESGSNGPDEKTIITGSSHKNLGGAILMSLRKKLVLAHQADEKARIKKRQMEILMQQMEESKKKEEEAVAKAAAKAATEKLKPSSSSARRTQSTNSTKNNNNRTRSSSSGKKPVPKSSGSSSKNAISSIAAAGSGGNASMRKNSDVNIPAIEEVRKQESAVEDDVAAIPPATDEIIAVPSEEEQQKELDAIEKEILDEVEN